MCRERHCVRVEGNDKEEMRGSSTMLVGREGSFSSDSRPSWDSKAFGGVFPPAWSSLAILRTGSALFLAAVAVRQSCGANPQPSLLEGCSIGEVDTPTRSPSNFRARCHRTPAAQSSWDCAACWTTEPSPPGSPSSAGRPLSAVVSALEHSGGLRENAASVPSNRGVTYAGRVL